MTATTPGLQPAARRMDLTGALILIALCAVWGGNTPAVKIANEGITPVFQAGLRSIGSGVLLILWCWVRGIRLFKLDGSLPLRLLVCNLLQLALPLWLAASCTTVTAVPGPDELPMLPFWLVTRPPFCTLSEPVPER